jgi:hypothetical protein
MQHERQNREDHQSPAREVRYLDVAFETPLTGVGSLRDNSTKLSSKRESSQRDT